jgi:ribonuclease I
MKKKKVATPKSRNWIAVRATLRGGAGRHKDKKKEASRKACRGAQKGRPFSSYILRLTWDSGLALGVA